MPRHLLFYRSLWVSCILHLVRAAKYPRNPAWHRRARSKRQQARRVLKQSRKKGTHCLRRGFATRIIKSLQTLKAHHTWPCYKTHPMARMEQQQGQAEESMVVDMGKNLSTASQGQREGQRKRLRQEKKSRKGTKKERSRRTKLSSSRTTTLPPHQHRLHHHHRSNRWRKRYARKSSSASRQVV